MRILMRGWKVDRLHIAERFVRARQLILVVEVHRDAQAAHQVASFDLLGKVDQQSIE